VEATDGTTYECGRCAWPVEGSAFPTRCSQCGLAFGAQAETPTGRPAAARTRQTQLGWVVGGIILFCLAILVIGGLRQRDTSPLTPPAQSTYGQGSYSSQQPQPTQTYQQPVQRYQQPQQPTYQPQVQRQPRVVYSTCIYCGGSGKCRDCGGTGTKSERSVYDQRREMTQTGPAMTDGVTVVRCGACSGSGKCNACRGTGKEERLSSY